MPAVAEAEHRARRADATLNAEQKALDAAASLARAARRRAVSTRDDVDRSAARRARSHVQRIRERVASARAGSRAARNSLRQAESQARLAQRIALVEDQLMADNLAADVELEAQLERSVEAFRVRKHESLKRSEERRRRKREAVAQRRIAALQERHGRNGPGAGPKKRRGVQSPAKAGDDAG